MSDWWEAFVISGRYGMGDPLARSSQTGRGPVHKALKHLLVLLANRLRGVRAGNSGGGRLARLEFWRASPVRNALK
jgi:hypothetical protein